MATKRVAMATTYSAVDVGAFINQQLADGAKNDVEKPNDLRQGFADIRKEKQK